jgi:hypothetical protein
MFILLTTHNTTNNTFKKYACFKRTKQKITFHRDEQEYGWRMNGYCHRVCGPAIVLYYKNGNIKHEIWYKYNRMHRIDGPAFISYYDNGVMYEKQWYENGEYSRLSTIYNIMLRK